MTHHHLYSIVLYANRSSIMQYSWYARQYPNTTALPCCHAVDSSCTYVYGEINLSGLSGNPQG